ncbi:hypothetical protein MUG94_02755 [Arthrobacter gengyunqii]|uniref:Uncharacterized protein n=1 Tax=Arthrobacter gengyunqii TaxID=2886940 RepID=A0A9X1M4A5_9MICC|nr:hypothetical protein [Arthrobacter gengyunqii]MCC3267714.1 hypothetical protein [Arthrobacter gengyunqii]MCC3270662.1 hypothetical protein [Arthrobacter gengyunqii]UOY96719.1 hypothetical protein MUG94_02755 [Arthrobacter gengyunqii]
MAEKENPTTGEDSDRTHNEAPSEGDTSVADSTGQRQHAQDAAEGDDADKK